MEHGAYFPDCRHAASAFTSTGIATLATGAWPAQHGIVAESWYDTVAKRPVPASEEALLATTLAAEIAADSRNRVYVIAMDRSAAALFAGSPDAGLFWMEENGAYTTNEEAPQWLAPFNQRHSPEAVRDGKWVAVGAKSDAPPLRVLTYDPAHPDDFLALYKSSPYAQDVQFDLLSELMLRESLGQGGGVDFVCLIGGALSRLGYETGGRHPLMQQLALRLDRRLEGLLAQANYNFLLTAAHGAPPLPSDEARARLTVNGETLALAIDKSLATNSLGRVRKYVYPFLYLNTEGFRDAEEVRRAAARAAMEQPSIAGYYTAGGNCSAHDEWERRFQNSFHVKRSGDVMLSYRPEAIEQYGQDRGVSYGSLYNYDVRVPLFLYGPAFRTGVYETAVQSVDFAPTLARVAGFAAPSSSTGRVLAEAILE